MGAFLSVIILFLLIGICCLFIWNVNCQSDLRKTIVELRHANSSLKDELKRVEDEKVSHRPLKPAMIFERLKQMDFDFLRQALANTNPDWNEARIEMAIVGYLKMLYLYGIQTTDEVYIPSIDVDKVWQLHILSTDRYLQDCIQLFNEIIHRPSAFVSNSTIGSAQEILHTTHFLAPSNTPTTIRASYERYQAQFLPWIMWWDSFRSNPDNHALTLHYDAQNHLFIEE
jgi:hypothetical protein